MIAKFFGWDRIPFTKEIPTELLFHSSGYKECIARLQYVVNNRLFGCLTGDIGSGKSTAIRWLRDNLDKNRYPFIYLSESSLAPKSFYRELLFYFGITPKYLRSEAKRQFSSVVSDFYENQGKTVTIVIDEAHELKGDMLQEIRFLTNFNVDSVSPLALILVGQPELRSTLHLNFFKPIAQRINIRFHLSGLDNDETVKYIEHQLKVAGSKHPVFTKEAMNSIYAYTFGIVRDINNICTACLLDAVIRKEQIIDTCHVDRIINEYKSY